MNGIFDLEGPLMDNLRRFSDIVIYNVLFVLASIPLITIGASLAALCEGVALIAEDKTMEVPAWRFFFGSFKKNFVTATKTWLVTAATAAYLLAMLHFVAANTKTGAFSGMGSVYTIIVYIFIFIFFMGYMNLFPARARWSEMSMLQGFVRAIQITIIALPWTLLGTFVDGVFIYVTLVMNLNVLRFGVFLWIVCGFGISAYLYSFFFLKGVERLQQIRH